MAERTLPGIGLTGFWDRGADYKSGMDTNLRTLSALTQLVVESVSATLPSSPSNGTITVNPADGKINIRDNGAWATVTPTTGWAAWAKDVSKLYRYSGTAWVEVAAGGGGGGSSALIGLTAAKLAADFTVTTGAWRSPTSWSIDRDNLSSYASGSDFTVPSGAAFCRVKMMTVWTSGDFVCYGMAYDTTDNTTYVGDIRDRNNEAFSSVSGPTIACTPGRTIRFQYNSGSGTGGIAGVSGSTFGKPTRIEIEWFNAWPA